MRIIRQYNIRIKWVSKRGNLYAGMLARSNRLMNNAEQCVFGGVWRCRLVVLLLSDMPFRGMLNENVVETRI